MYDYFEYVKQYGMHPMAISQLDALCAAANIHAQNGKFIQQNFKVEEQPAGSTQYGDNPSFGAGDTYRHISNTGFSVFIQCTTLGYQVNYHDDMTDYGSLDAYFDKGKVKTETYKYMELLQKRIYMDLLSLQQERYNKVKQGFIDDLEEDDLEGLPIVEDLDELDAILNNYHQSL